MQSCLNGVHNQPSAESVVVQRPSRDGLLLFSESLTGEAATVLCFSKHPQLGTAPHPPQVSMLLARQPYHNHRSGAL